MEAIDILILTLATLCFLYAFRPMATDPDLVFRFARERVPAQYKEWLRLAREQKFLYQADPEVARRLEDMSLCAVNFGLSPR